MHEGETDGVWYGSEGYGGTDIIEEGSGDGVTFGCQTEPNARPSAAWSQEKQSLDSEKLGEISNNS